jgi:tetratricopeptide (TPR) repeat protein
MTRRTIRNLLAIGSLLAVGTISVFLLYRFLENRPLSRDLFIALDEDTHSLVRSEPAVLIRSLLGSAVLKGEYSPITVDYPFNKSVFPPEIVAPTFLWHDPEEAVDLWLIDITFKNNPFHIYALTAGRQAEPQIDPEAVSSTNEHYRRSDYDVSAKAWTPDERAWEIIKRNCVEAFATVAIIGFGNGDRPEILSRGSMQLMVSKDPVGAPIFYRDVPLMPSETTEGVIKPIAKGALPLIVWRLRDISKPSASVVLEDMPTCVNCHTFSRDGKVLGMDMDGPGGDKGAYGLTRVKKRMTITDDDIITWNSYRYSPKGHKNFGLFSQVSPNGKYVISTLNETTFVANYPDFRFLQSFYPTRGIFAVYYKDTGRMEPLPGANDTNYVHTNACWSPDGRDIVFSRAKAKNNYETKMLPRHVGDPNETFIQYDLYVMPFNDGGGGLPTRLEGVSRNGMSNSFPRYSPDGKWIVFVQTDKGQLMRPESRLYIIPAKGGKARKMNCNLPVMNSWHSWSPNGKWLVFSSKGFTPFTQMFLTHIDENGNDSPAILIPNSTAANRAVNIPEFLNNSTDAIASISTPVQDSYRHFHKANELVDSGQHAEALAELEKSLALNPYYAKAHNDKGYVLFKMGKYQEAVSCFEKALQLDPELAMAYSNYGFVLESMGRIDEAISRYNRALEINPMLTNAMCNLANVFRVQGKLDKAGEYYRKALEIKPYLTEARSNLGVVLQGQGSIDEAISYFRKALETEDDYVPAHYNLGLAFQSQGKIDEALDCFEKAIQLQDDYVPAHYSLGTVFQSQGNIDQAISQYRKVLQLSPDHTNAYYSLGVATAMKGHSVEAIGYFRESLNRSPNNADAHYNLAGLLSGSGELPEAAKHYNEALRIKPDHFKAQANLAGVLVKLGRIPQALDLYYRMLKVNPQQVGVLNIIAWILATSDDVNVANPTRAINFAQKACELTNYEVPQLLDTLAAAYAAAGEFGKAVETAEKAVQSASAADNVILAERIGKRLELYKQNRPYRDSQRSPE